MCGVAGIFSLTGAPVANAEQRIARMTGMLDHRGPDGSGWRVTDDRLLAGLPNSPYFSFSRDWHWLALAVYDGAPGRAAITVLRVFPGRSLGE